MKATQQFDGNQVNIYDLHNTIITVSRAAIIQGWRELGTSELFWIPLIPIVCNNNTETFLVKHQVTTKRVSSCTAATAGRRFQCLRAENSTGTSVIPPCLRWFPNKTDVALCSQEQTVCIMARPDSQSNHQTLPRIQRNTQGTRPDDQERPTINKMQPRIGK